MPLIISIISVLLLIFWCVQFLRLMRMKSDEFTTANDKLIWAAAFLVMTVLGALLFWIYFKPKIKPLPQLSTDIYDMAKQKFPDCTKEIDLALKMVPGHRYDLEKWYGKQSPQELRSHYQNFSPDVDPGCFGVLLAVLTAHPVDTETD